MSARAEDDFISMGDIVEHKMNTDVLGIVIGIAGSLIYIRTSPSLATLAFHEWELRIAEKETPPSDSAETPIPQADNVIQVDFTKKRPLNKNTKTEGAA
ncbi:MULTISPECIES: hypothetical protein [unclassified Sinorhizobium]|uniref:hypothetical protein n=1 Tax=unclassified Sinorhizobium TaxID=2613772 RepID=UPI0035265B03